MGPRPTLDHAAALLASRVHELSARARSGDEAAWSGLCEAVAALAAALRVTPPEAPVLLTTEQMARRLGVSPKTLLKHKSRGAVRPALQKGKLIRWRGTEPLT